jgi:hypothetical protein
MSSKPFFSVVQLSILSIDVESSNDKDEGLYRVVLRIEREPSSIGPTETVYREKLRLNFAQLRECAFDPQAYGRVLSTQLFALVQLREQLNHELANAVKELG